MRKSLIPIAALALMMASCDTGVRDSYQTYPFREYNLIVDKDNYEVPAQVSEALYNMKYNISKNVVDINGSNITINNQKSSFETDTMTLKGSYFEMSNGTKVDKLYFSKNSNVVLSGSKVTNLSGKLLYGYVSNTLDPTVTTFTISTQLRLDLSYEIEDRYHVQTFWPSAYFKGRTNVVDGSSSLSVKDTDYFLQINFAKNYADVYIYNPEYMAEQPKDYPELVKIGEVPIIFSHDGFSFKGDSPKTTIPGIVDNKNTMVESDKFKATDFELNYVSPDLTEISISYNIDGKSVSFHGYSVLAPGM